MPRAPRHCVPGKLQHIISRFVDREYWLADLADRAFYIREANRSLSNVDWRPLAYALMSSHVHWATVAGTRSLASWMKPLHVSYSSYWHKRYGGLGPVFCGRPQNWNLPAEQLPRLIAYLHMNPVRAGVCARPHDSTWTSHQHYLRLTPAPKWLDVEYALSLCGFSDTQPGRAAFDDFVRSYKPQIKELITPRRDHDCAIPTPTIAICSWNDLLVAVAQSHHLAPHQISSPSRARPISQARRSLARIAHTKYGFSATSIAKQLHLTEGAIRHMLRSSK